jgi:hypothetical protein
LIKEVFEKATTQHHFIDMYADLCTLLHEHFAEHPIGDSQFSFKRLLLNECQASFESNLKPPSELKQLTSEERILLEVKYKTRMLGNLKFIGALLARKMLASKVFIAIAEELLSMSTPESLESLAAILTVVGPVFDTPMWSYRPVFNHFLEQIQGITRKPSCDSRARCLLKDVLDLRAAGWKSRRPKKVEGPTTLNDVARQAEGLAPASPPTPMVLKATAKALTAPASKVEERPAAPAFDGGSFRAEIAKILVELRYSGDATEAAMRLEAQSPPPRMNQPIELCHVLTKISEEGSVQVRQVGFKILMDLFAKRKWRKDAASEGLRMFVEEACEDLRCDVPNLPQILKEDLHPACARLAGQGFFTSAQLDQLIS